MEKQKMEKKTGVVIVELGDEKIYRVDSTKQGNIPMSYPTACLAGWLEDRGRRDVDIIQQKKYDFNHEGKDYSTFVSKRDIANMVSEKASSNDEIVVGIRTVTANYIDGLEAAKYVKEKVPNAKIVIGGYHSTELKEQVYNGDLYNTFQNQMRDNLGDSDKNLVDVFAVGEGEKTLEDIVKVVESSENPDWSKVEGVVYYDKKAHKGRYTGRRDRICLEDNENMFSLPKAKREVLVPLKDEEGNYEGAVVLPSSVGVRQIMSFPDVDDINSTQISSSRGCYGECSFCSSAEVWGRNVKNRPSAEVVDEIVETREKYGINHVYFSDLAINQNLGCLEDLCKELSSREKNGEKVFGGESPDNVHWFALANAFDVESLGAEKVKKYLSMMKEAGCSKIGVGVEGFTPTDMTGMKNLLDDPIDRTMNALRTLKYASDEGIITRGFFMYGLENHDEDSAKMAKNLIGLEVPEYLFDNSDSMRIALSAIYQDEEFKEVPNSGEFLDKLVNDYLRHDGVFNESSLEKTSRLFNVDHVRIVHETPYYSTDIAKSRKLRIRDYKRDLDGRVIFGEDGHPVLNSNGFHDFGKDGITLKEAFDGGEDWISELLTQSYPVCETKLDIDSLEKFPQELVKAAYFSDGYRKDVRKKVEKFSYLKGSFNTWKGLLENEFKEKLDWGIGE